MGIADHPLDPQALIGSVTDPACGGIAVFVGTVRESPAVAKHAGKEVVALDYEAHPELAHEALETIARQVVDRWDVRRLAAWHRTGCCRIGDPTVVIACAAPHRGDALEACAWMIDQIKSEVPIWKREVYSDGSAWVGAEGAR